MASRGGLAGVLDTFGAAYLAEHPLNSVQAKAWRAITACRTAALGGQLASCNACGTLRYVYHSCRNRHCPQCQTRAKEAWLAARRRELLPVPYFHLVFTLPHCLNGLVGQRPRLIYERLFASVAATLTEFATNPRWLGGTPAFTLVLHTWQQDLSRHVHVHALVAGGALTAAGDWASARRGFLFPVQALSTAFRGKFVAALQALRENGKWDEIAHPPSWPLLLAQLYAHDWVVYAKQPLGGPAQVLEYLGRYTRRVAISNERIVRIDENKVAFRVRTNARGRKRLCQLAGPEFIRRFLQHVLPQGFKRIRHYGLLGPAHKTVHLATARAALGAPPPQAAVIESVAAFMQRVARIAWDRCPHCHVGRFEVVQPIPPARVPRTERGPP